LYEFRRRAYRYTVENQDKDDLIFGQFEKLTAQFIELAKIMPEYCCSIHTVKNYNFHLNKFIQYVENGEPDYATNGSEVPRADKVRSSIKNR
jgi:hypothetical protein